MRVSLVSLLVVLAGCGQTASTRPTTAQVTICPEGATLLASGGCGPVAPPPRPKELAAGPREDPRDPPKAGPARVARKGPGLQGRWHGEESDAERYFELSVFEDGRFRQEITKIASISTSPDTCVQEGDLHIDGESMVWHYESNECNHAYDGQTEAHPILERNDHEFAVRYGSYTIHYERQR